MATGTYGTIRPSDVSPEDVDIIMLYTPSRDETDNFVLTKLNSVSLLKPYFNNAQTGGNTDVEVLGGLYNLKLPSDQFNKLGAENHGFKATTLAPVNRKIRVQWAGLTCKQCQ